MAVIDAEQRLAMRGSLARLLLARCTEADVRRVMATDHAHDSALWHEMAELGVLSTLIPEAYGGLGGGAREMGALMEEVGKVLLPGPFFSSAVLATTMIAESDDIEAKEEYLSRLAGGRLIATVAIAGEAGQWSGEDGEIVAGGPPAKLSGMASFVSDAALAELLFVVAGRGSDRQLYVLTDRVGVTLTPLPTFDPTQRLARLRLDGVRARPVIGGDAAAIDRALELAAVALASRQAGSALRNFEFTVEYLRTRVQFGRPIGGFQAVKHMAADLLLECESATTVARHAADCLASGTPEAPTMAALAGFAVNDAQIKIAFDSIQLHGGIGFTWEHPAHLYLRRARHDSMFLGTSQQARERYLTLLEKLS